MKVKIKVTDKHIKKGIDGSTTHCPISLALSDDKSLNVLAVSTGFHFCYMHTEKDTYRADLTKKARKFISDFDSGKKVKPMEATLIFE